MKTSNTLERLFTPLCKERAPEEVLPVLEHVERLFGFIPNLMGTFANAPAAAKGYHALIVEFTKSSFTPQEQQLVLLATSAENNGLKHFNRKGAEAVHLKCQLQHQEQETF